MSQQLLEDLGRVRGVLAEKGWATGALFVWKLHMYRGGTVATADTDDFESVCMTGAAGFAIEEAPFIQYAWTGGSNLASGYGWSERGLNVLRALVEVARREIRRHDCMRCSGLMHDMGPRDKWSADHMIRVIVHVNDEHLLSKDNARRWVESAIAQVKADLPEPDAPGVGLKRKVVRVEAGAAKQEKEDEVLA